MSEPYLTLLGLALRAGRLVWGIDSVTDAVKSGRACAVLCAADLGAAARRQAFYLAESRGVELIELPAGKRELGDALRRGTPGVLALTDEGFAGTLKQKLNQTCVSIDSSGTKQEDEI